MKEEEEKTNLVLIPFYRHHWQDQMDCIHGGIIEEEEEQAISHYSPPAYIYISITILY